jgi:hypothetical protein
MHLKKGLLNAKNIKRCDSFEIILEELSFYIRICVNYKSIDMYVCLLPIYYYVINRFHQIDIIISKNYETKIHICTYIHLYRDHWDRESF